MYRFLESIAIVEGEVQRLYWHQRRVNATLDTFYKGTAVNLQDAIHAQRGGGNGTVKCRVTYDGTGCEVQFSNYRPREIRTLQVVEGPDIDYAFKFADRTAIETAFEKRGKCDDILILKEGKVTDSAIANIAFRRSKDWYTPRTPLLKGTMRQYLIDHALIRLADITTNDISTYESFKLVNAMLAFDSPEYPVSNIHF